MDVSPNILNRKLSLLSLKIIAIPDDTLLLLHFVTTKCKTPSSIMVHRLTKGNSDRVLLAYAVVIMTLGFQR